MPKLKRDLSPSEIIWDALVAKYQEKYYRERPEINNKAKCNILRAWRWWLIYKENEKDEGT